MARCAEANVVLMPSGPQAAIFVAMLMPASRALSAVGAISCTWRSGSAYRQRRERRRPRLRGGRSAGDETFFLDVSAVNIGYRSIHLEKVTIVLKGGEEIAHAQKVEPPSASGLMWSKCPLPLSPVPLKEGNSPLVSASTACPTCWLRKDTTAVSNLDSSRGIWRTGG